MTRIETFRRDDDPHPDDLPRTVIDRYHDWASSVTDAPTQYHRATGVVILSTLLCPHIFLRLEFGEMRPNIWMMMLAGTTVTRKSTSLDLAISMLNDVTDDFMLATDGSPEGLLTELAFRDGKPSLFHRDEITGFMSKVTGQDYMSGILESFTRLYDGKPEKRILRNESIEIKNPYLVFMSGGIKSRMEEIVGMEHIRSGFLPRFLFVTGSTTSDQIRPIGPPKEESLREDGTAPRDLVQAELWSINQYYTNRDSDEGKSVVKIAGITKIKAKKQGRTEIRGTPEAWNRIRDLKDDAIRMGERASSPELYTPLYDRLTNTIIKIALLLAGADKSSFIEYEHVCKAIAMSDEWLEAVNSFAKAIEEAPDMDKWEKKADKISQWVRSRYPQPTTQTQVMQKFRIRKSFIDDIEATLVARGAINITPYPHPKTMTGGKILYEPSNEYLNLHGNVKGMPPPNSIQKEDSFHATPQRHTQNGSEPNQLRERRRLRRIPKETP